MFFFFFNNSEIIEIIWRIKIRFPEKELQKQKAKKKTISTKVKDTEPYLEHQKHASQKKG